MQIGLQLINSIIKKIQNAGKPLSTTAGYAPLLGALGRTVSAFSLS